MFVKLFTTSLAALVFFSCAAPRRVPHYFDANNPLKRVAVLPLKNDTDDADAPNTVRKKIIEALEAKSYIILDVKETDQMLRDQMGINLGGQLEMTTPQKLGEVLNVEGLLYGTLMDFDESTTGVLNVRKVRAKFKLVNAQTGQAFWERGLGVRSETRMSGRSGDVAAAVARGADAREKDTPWITLDSYSLNERNVGQAFAIGLGAKLLTKAVGIHLEHESKEMVRRVTESLPWGPGPGAISTAPAVAMPALPAPRMQSPEPPSFGYMDYGKKDLTALLISVSVDRHTGESTTFSIPLAKAGDSIRMDIDLSAAVKSGESMPAAISRISTIHRGDKNSSHTLYPNSRKYMTHAPEEGGAYEKPQVTKTKIGSEVVDGHPADKYRITIKYKNGRIEEGYIWNARDLGQMTIRSEVENKDARITAELKNVSIKRPAAALFEIPAGYTEAQNFMELMTETK